MIIKNLVNDLHEKGLFYQESVFSFNEVDDLIKESNTRFFVKAGIGKNKDIDNEIRSDEISWLTENESSMAVIRFLNFVKELSETLNQEFFLGINDFEAHFANYPVGSYYKTHVDNFRGQNNRVITVILYLNKEWKDGDGGEVCIHKNNSEILLSPSGGSVLCFVSKDTLHEVLPTNKIRLSLTGWMLNSKIFPS
ncbi:2OG-Fe(II) oxygenase [Citrobacter meridianamericanus]|uniref:2OG-Fe(II) oxygenase n=1 Tax=Citrobacter meridianamericanus TaxID=2894201 RepID=A0ABT1B709_9ENTR|nr:2OG-Fe(II) oxygenase [Citrobacter meridianamericanus]MCO5781378.1 2OG-Fe(II) oxygenase [Citrobacter meridianamericanus]